MSKLKGPDGRIPDRLPDGRPAVAWERRWTEGTLPLWLVATAGGIAVIFVLGIFFYGSPPFVCYPSADLMVVGVHAISANAA